MHIGPRIIVSVLSKWKLSKLMFLSFLSSQKKEEGKICFKEGHITAGKYDWLELLTPTLTDQEMVHIW